MMKAKKPQMSALDADWQILALRHAIKSDSTFFESVIRVFTADGSRVKISITYPRPPGHTRTGNCWKRTRCDVCMKHQEPRGSCAKCPPCKPCDRADGR